MKVRKLLMMFAFVALFALTGTGIGLMTLPANADDAKAAVTITEVKWNDGYNQMLITTDMYCGSMEMMQGDKTYVEVKEPTGEPINIISVQNQDHTIFLYFGKMPEVGTVITFKAGYAFGAEAEIKADISYQCVAPKEAFQPYVPEGTEKAAVHVNNVNWAAWANQILVETDTDSKIAGYDNRDVSFVEVKGPDGQAIVPQWVQVHDHHIFINIGKEPEVNTIVTIKAGFPYIATAEVKEEVSYIYSTQGQTFAVYTSEPVEKEAVTVKDVNWAAWAGQILVATNSDSGIPDGSFGPGDTAHIKAYDAIGEEIPITALGEQKGYIFIQLNNGIAPEIGTVITIQAGYSFSATAEFKEDVSYIYVTQDQPFVPNSDQYKVTSFSITNDPADNVVRVHAAKQLTWTVNEGAATTPHFTSGSPNIATVDANGVVTGVAVGQAVITAQAGTLTSAYTVDVKPALAVSGLDWGVSYKIWVEKGGSVSIPADFTAHAVFQEEGAGENLNGPDFPVTAENCTLDAVDTNTVGTAHIKATVTYEETPYKLDLDVEVYEVYPMEIKEVAVVDWFNYYIFVEYPNSSINSANLTDTSLIPDASKFEYFRADGTPVPSGAWVLGNGNLLVMPNYYDGGQNAENWSSAPYMQAGDRLVLKQGLAGYMWTGELAPTETDNNAIAPHTGMVVRECVLEQEVTYVFDGNLWVVYIPYTDLDVKSELTLVMGDSANLGALRVPGDATEGTLSYAVEDEKIATVSNTGRVTAVGIGETTVTVTLSGGVAGDKTKTVKITVTDGIVSLQFAEGSSLTVKQGTETLDLSGLTANLVYASGKTEQADLSKAEIVGYDKDAAGETEVTVKVTVDGKTYQAQLTVIVEAASGGCGSVIGSAFIGAFVALGAAALVLKKKD